jgi:hypothetical protein
MALTGSVEVNKHAISRFKNQLGENGAFRLITPEEMKDNEIISAETLFSKKDDYINLIEVARDYPKINEIPLKSRAHFLKEINKLNEEKDAIPLFIKDNEGVIHIIGSYNDEMKIDEGYQLIYLGKPLELI